MSAAELIDRLRAWPSPQIGADYSVNAIKAQMAEAADLIEALSAHPAPIKPSADTGELRERVAEAKEWIDEAECRRGCSTWRPDVHGRSRCDCGREAAADAILDLIQSERAG